MAFSFLGVALAQARGQPSLGLLSPQTFGWRKQMIKRRPCTLCKLVHAYRKILKSTPATESSRRPSPIAEGAVRIGPSFQKQIADFAATRAGRTDALTDAATSLS